MNDRRYSGRHRAYVARHRTAPRIPRALTGGAGAPSVLAAVLVAAAAGASAFTGSAGEQAATVLKPAPAPAAMRAVHDAGHAEARKEMQLKAEAVRAHVEAQRRADRARERAELRRKNAIQAKETQRQARADAARRERNRWVLPIEGAEFTSGFGYRWGRMHQGDDYAAPIGTRLSAMSRGIVISAGPAGAYGNKVQIRYGDGTVSVYAHMDSIAVGVGDHVSAGQFVGRTGNSGRSTGPHLHLEIHPSGGAAVDPSAWLSAKGIQA